MAKLVLHSVVFVIYCSQFLKCLSLALVSLSAKTGCQFTRRHTDALFGIAVSAGIACAGVLAVHVEPAAQFD